MIAFRLKNTVVADGIDYHIWFALGFAAALHLRLAGTPLVVTSLRDSVHNDFSLHYDGKAMDVRVHDLSPTQKNDFFGQLKMALDPLGFDTIMEDLGNENCHIHCEFDPKPGEQFLHILV